MTKIQNPLDRCDFKQKFNALWHRAYSAIRFINGKGVEDGEGSVTLTAEDIPDVQPLLTAGENITIEDNVISATGGGSAPVWGNITGTLADQTDLKDALDGKEDAGTSYTKAETDVLLSYKADVSSVEAIEDEIGAVGQAGTIRNDISLVNDRVDTVEDEIGPETTAGTLRYKIKENSNDIISIENEIDIIDGIIAAHATAINDKADKTYVDAHISDTSNPHMVSKAQVGLSNVDNTSDAAKPISTATQNALNNKADDNDVVHKTGTESIAGVKTFTDGAVNIGDADSSVQQYTDASGTRTRVISFNTAGNVIAYLDLYANADGTISLKLQKRRRSDLAYLDQTTITTL